MNNLDKQTGDLSNEQIDAPNKGMNLWLAYSLVALALAAAIGFALLIVLPFYHRR